MIVFVKLGLVAGVLAERLAGTSVSEMVYL